MKLVNFLKAFVKPILIALGTAMVLIVGLFIQSTMADRRDIPAAQEAGRNVSLTIQLEMLTTLSYDGGASAQMTPEIARQTMEENLQSIIDENNGYVAINNETLLKDICNNTIKEVTEYNFIGNKRASIETFMHSILKKYTIHLHPIQVNRILVTKKAKSIIKEIYPNSLVIDYFTPGIKVCNEIKEKFHNENVVFLINHGIIITCDNYDEIYKILEEVLCKFEIYQNLSCHYKKYKNTNKITAVANNLFNTNNVSYLCEDATIKHYLNNKIELFKESITFPDFLIYCGLEILFHLNYIEEYKNKYNEPPKIIIDDGNIYINSISITKCKEIEEVLKSSLMILDTDLKKNILTFEEICFLNNWDAEKYRKFL